MADSRKLDYTYQISITPHYREFLNFFRERGKIGYNDLIVGAHMIYGRMPTMLRMNTADVDTVLELLKRIKVGGDTTLADLSLLQITLNNSMVGTSKLLHFLDPKRFAIWDSRIFRYITRTKGQTGISRAQNYLEYLSHLRDIVRRDDFTKVHDFVQGEMQTSHTVMRTAEIVMFEWDKMEQKRSS